MASISSDVTLKQLQEFSEKVYGLPNNRDFDLEGLHSNMNRFAMRSLKGIRKGDVNKIKINLLISLSFFSSVINQFRINPDSIIWRRFPYLCSYCGACPCKCKKEKLEMRRQVIADESKKPKTVKDFQQMFEVIYPASKRTLGDAGIHLAEELGELSEAILKFRGTHREPDLYQVEVEIADVFSCMMGIFNSLGVNVAEELAAMFYDNCHVCHKAPCICPYELVMDFPS